MATQYIVNFTDPEVTPFNVNSFTTDGPVAPTTLQLSSTAVRASTSLLLYGKGHPEYGERIQENLINIMENFSGATIPKYPVSGQTWFARITYAFTGVGSPTTGNVYRWIDDSSLANGGYWKTLVNVGASDPTAADEVKTSGAQPTTVVDGAFWLDTVGSPAVPELYIGVNNTSSNMTATWLKREIEDLTDLVGPGGQFSSFVPGSPELGNYLPQKQLKVYDGVQWKNAGNVYVNHVPPLSPAIGDMWYQTGVVGSPPAGSPTLGGGGGPLSQLFIWARPGPGKAPRWLTTGYLDRTGDTMTGALYFGLPTYSLVIWENGGNDTAGSDIRFVNNGLLSSDTNLYIHIDNDSVLGSPLGDAAATNVFEVATGSDARDGNQTSLFRVRADGVIETAVSLGSPEGSTYTNLILGVGDANSLVHRGYVDDVITTVSTLTARVTVNETNINLLNGGGSPIEAKVNRSGDTMTGTLTFSSVGSPLTGNIAIDAGLFLISNVQTPIGPDDAATKGYVDDQLSALGSPIGVDTYVSNAYWTTGSNTLTLERTAGEPDINVPITISVTTGSLSHTVTTPFLRDTFQEAAGSPSLVLFGSPLALTLPPLQPLQSEINDVAVEGINSRLSIVELPYARQILPGGLDFGSPVNVGGSPVNNLTYFSFTHDTYIAGTNRLAVYVNGVKQYANERAHQHIEFNNISGLSSSSRTFIDRDVTPYTLLVSVDGGSPATEMTVTGNQVQFFQDIVDEINTQITGATAVWNFPNQAIDVYSNSTGTGSSIQIIDGALGSPLNGPSSLLGVLSITTRPAEGSPLGSAIAYTLGNIAPAAGGPITTVTQNLAYFEATSGSPVIDATFGQQASTVAFNTPLQIGDTIELIYAPVSS